MAHNVSAIAQMPATNPTAPPPAPASRHPLRPCVVRPNRRSNALTGAGVDEGISWLAEHSESMQGRKGRK